MESIDAKRMRVQGDWCLRPCTSDVILNMYHLNASAGWLNKRFLRSAELGLVHVGVQVWGSEWSFRYYSDTWDDPHVTGVHRYEPHEPDSGTYVFAESLMVGSTPFSSAQVYQLLRNLKNEWPASSYHLTRRNCVTFAQHLIQELQVATELPKWIRGASEFGADHTLVEYGWSWAKSYMIWRNAPAQTLPVSPTTKTCEEEEDPDICHPKGELLGLTLIPF